MTLLQNLNFRKKILISFIILIVISNCISSIVVLGIVKPSIEKKSIEYEQDLVMQISTTIDTYLYQVDRLSIRAAYSRYVLSLLEKRYNTPSSIMLDYTMDKESAFTYLSQMTKITDGIENIFIYNKEGNPYYSFRMGELDSDYRVQTEPWYEQILDSREDGYRKYIGVHTPQQLNDTNRLVVSVVRKIRDIENFQGLGIIKVDIDITIFEQLIKEAGRNTRKNIYLVDDAGKIIYSSKADEKTGDYIDKEIFHSIVSGSSPGYMKQINNHSTLVSYVKSSQSGWYVVTLTEKAFLSDKINFAAQMFFFAGIISVIVAFIFSLVISNTIVKPIKILEKRIAKIEMGDFDDIVEWNSKDEIGSLANSFNRMSKRLKQLIEQIYYEETEKRKVEITALQAQINPHFIFNTLNTIKYMAVLQRASSIVDMLDAFTTLVRAVLKSSSELLTIREELKRIRSYVYIEQTRFYGKFDIDFEYNDEVLNYKTIGLLLQPIIENAIFHGIEPKIERNKIEKGQIKVNISKIDNAIEFCVEDNGIGMRQSTIERVLDPVKNKSNSIGIYNVNKRIKLNFGNDYGITIDSIVNCGSTVKIRIPAIPDSEDSDLQ